MAELPRLRNVVTTQARMYASLTDLVVAQLVALWRAFGGWYDGDLVNAQSARSATLVEAAQRQARERQRAYLRAAFQELGLTFPTLPTVQDQYPRQGALISEVWERPAEQFRYQESVGASAEEALESAVQRVETLADTDVSLAKRDAAREVFEATPRVTGYRRIIHPELSESGTCGLCVVAADRVYSVGELLPIHDRCNCDVLPVTSGDDPGLSLNREDLNKLYEAAGSTAGEDLARLRVTVTDHGELGPILRTQGHRVADGGDRARSSGRGGKGWTDPDPRASIEAQLRTLEPSLANLRRRAAAGEDVAAPLRWQADRVAELRRRLQQLGESA